MAESKKLNYSRDDVYIISLNKTSDDIELTKIKCYNQIISVYEYFARIEACYDKSWKYMKDSKYIESELRKFRDKLYNPNLLKDIREGSRQTKVEMRLVSIFNELTALYRQMTGSYIETGLFPKFYVETDEPSAVRQSRLD